MSDEPMGACKRWHDRGSSDGFVGATEVNECIEPFEWAYTQYRKPYCPICGYKACNETRYCPNCGRRSVSE